MSVSFSRRPYSPAGECDTECRSSRRVYEENTHHSGESIRGQALAIIDPVWRRVYQSKSSRGSVDVLFSQ